MDGRQACGLAGTAGITNRRFLMRRPDPRRAAAVATSTFRLREVKLGLFAGEERWGDTSPGAYS